ncbi:MAG: glycosyltransferase family 25 protein [Pseudaminobacter sp.]
MHAEAFIIHLARAQKRRPQVDALKSSLPLPVHVVDAVDGAAMTDKQVATVYRREIHRPRYPFELRKAEIGCFLSHRKVWREIVDRQLDAGLIVEDDVEVDAKLFPAVLAMALANIRPGDFIRFPRRDGTDKGARIGGEETRMLCQPLQAGLGTQMQLVGRQAAIELLKATERFDRPIDTTLQMRWLSNARVLAAMPVCIRQIDHLLGGTVIQQKAKPFSEVLSREVRRTWYRLSVRVANAAAR